MLYYVEDNVVAVIDIDDDTMHLLGIISNHKVNLKGLINKITTKEIKQVIFHFTPDIEDENLICKKKEENELFIRSESIKLPDYFVFPTLSQS